MGTPKLVELVVCDGWHWAGWRALAICGAQKTQQARSPMVGGTSGAPGHPRSWRAQATAHERTPAAVDGVHSLQVCSRPSIRISISDTWTASLLASVSVCWSTFKGSAPIAADENCKWAGSGWVLRTGVSKLCTKAGCWEWQAGWRPHHQPPPALRAS